MRLLPFSQRSLRNQRIYKKLSTFHSQLSILRAFSLVELMIVVSVIAILTAGAIPSFTDFTRSQSLYQSFKTLKSDLRVAQARSLSGSEAKAWGIHFYSSPSDSYTIFRCTPVATLSDYDEYLFANSRCGSGVGYKTVNLGSNTRITDLRIGVAPQPAGLDVVFDAQNGSTVAGGASPGADVTITVDYTSGGSPQILRITQGGGIID